ncbi:MAG: glycosyltransferase family 4 protein [Luteibacter sp.]
MPLHVAQVNFLAAPSDCPPERLFERWPSLADIPEAAAAGGVRVSMIQAAACDASLVRAGVAYRFVDVRGARSPRQRARRVAGVLREIGAQLVHVHSLGFARTAALLRRELPGVPLLLQDHADRPPRAWLRQPWRRWYAAADGIAFTAPEQATPFTANRLFDTRTRLFAIPESTSRFLPGDATFARGRTGMHGHPCVLSVGHLSPHKGTMTLLDGVARAVERMPGLRLWCAFGRAPLLDAVRRRVDEDPRLSGRVHLLGAVTHAQVERLMQSADLFVSASLAEGSGYSMLEALACGITPVVTDIPAFRVLTGGAVGERWPAGDAVALADALCRAAAREPSVQRVRDHFERTLSFAALGRRWAAAYAELLDARGQPT